VPDAGISIIWGGMAAAAVTASAAIGSAWIARQIKIAEFRQAWINELRKDIADYTGVAYRWFHKFHEIEELKPEDRTDRMRQELVPIVNEASVILRRIKLRINPRDNVNKEEDDQLIQSLDDLVSISKLDPRQLATSWVQLCDVSVERAREILKREWEVTKHPIRGWIKAELEA